MASMEPLRSLVIFLGLLHLCVPDINTVCLKNMTQYFYDKVQPKTKNQTDAQYALAIFLPPAHCTYDKTNIRNKFSEFDAAHVRTLLNDGRKCEFCTEEENVIASRPVPREGGRAEHSEHVLLYPVSKSLMDTLLKKARGQSCVVFYSFNSPCVDTCLRSDDNILTGLENWKNQRKDQMNAFVFQKVWQKDKPEVLRVELRKIDAIVPLYRCTQNKKGQMECVKCVEKDKVIDFCVTG